MTRPRRPFLPPLAPALLLALAPNLGMPVEAQQAPAPAPQPPPCQEPHYRDFDFWIGEWRVTGPNGEQAGENSITSILNGCVIQENWNGVGGSIGRSFNMYNARTGKWQQTWVDGNGGRLDLVGGVDERGRMVLSGETPGREGGAVRHEIAWTAKPDGTVEQHWRASKDGGETWNDLFLGIYKKKD